MVRSDISEKEVLELYDNGKRSPSEIASILGCSYAAIKRRLDRNGIVWTRSAGMQKHYQNARDSVSWDLIKSELDEGKSVTAIMADLHVGRARINQMIQENGYAYTRTKSMPDDLRQKLSKMRQQGLSVAEMADVLGKSVTTVGRYLMEAGLTVKPDRSDISDEDVLKAWNSGQSIVSIAKMFLCSHDTVTKRLQKYGISCGRAEGIERHFDLVHDEDWEAIRSDLDADLPVSIIATRHNIRYESIFRMMERNHYHYNGFGDFDEDGLKLKISRLDEDGRKYAEAILAYYDEYKNFPVIYTLCRFMGIPRDELKQALMKYDLMDFIGSSGPTVVVTKILNDLDKLGLKYRVNDRSLLTDGNKNYEMDIYLPDYKLGIEVNPAWTHSIDTMPYGQPDRNYHQKKSLMAINAGVGLLHMYDADIYEDDKYAVFLQQMSALGKDKKKIGARKCSIKEINRGKCNNFLKKYHFQGIENASFVRYGLFYDDNLVGVMSFGVPRYTEHDYEIIRYCMDPEFIVMGGFDKLLHAFIKSVGSGHTIVSYMDLNKRIRSADVYQIHGFKYDGLTEPDYVWVSHSGRKTKSRYSVTKKQLVKQGFDASMSEAEIMRSLDYCRVYGAGSKRYVLQM